MATELILIRHGNAVRMNGDYLHAPLTALGRQQAMQTGRCLCETHQPIDGFYTSPVRRAKETAAIIGSEIGEKPKVKSGVRELETLEALALAVLEAFSMLDPVEDYLDAHAGKSMRWPLEGRVSRVLTELVARHPNRQVAVVAHSGVISSALAWLFPAQRLHWWTTLVGNCSLTRIAIDGTRAELLAVNETQHLIPVVAIAEPPARAVKLARKVLQTKKRRAPKHR